MEKAGTKCRDIQFFSQKNQEMVCVHSHAARAYAGHLEADSQVKAYEACQMLDKGKYQFVNNLGIRKEYFDTQWTTDFVIQYEDGRKGIREIATGNMLTKKAAMEKLEFSRRYWSASSAGEWKIVMMEKEDGSDVL